MEFDYNELLPPPRIPSNRSMSVTQTPTSKPDLEFVTKSSVITGDLHNTRCDAESTNGRPLDCQDWKQYLRSTLVDKAIQLGHKGPCEGYRYSVGPLKNPGYGGMTVYIPVSSANMMEQVMNYLREIASESPCIKGSKISYYSVPGVIEIHAAERAHERIATAAEDRIRRDLRQAGFTWGAWGRKRTALTGAGSAGITLADGSRPAPDGQVWLGNKNDYPFIVVEVANHQTFTQALSKIYNFLQLSQNQIYYGVIIDMIRPGQRNPSSTSLPNETSPSHVVPQPTPITGSTVYERCEVSVYRAVDTGLILRTIQPVVEQKEVWPRHQKVLMQLGWHQMDIRCPEHIRNRNFTIDFGKLHSTMEDIRLEDEDGAIIEETDDGGVIRETVQSQALQWTRPKPPTSAEIEEGRRQQHGQRVREGLESTTENEGDTEESLSGIGSSDDSYDPSTDELGSDGS